MKTLLLLLLPLLIALPAIATTSQEKRDDERKIWLERIFGSSEERETATKEKKEDREEAIKEAHKDAEDKDKAKEAYQNKVKSGKEFSEEEREVLESWQKGNAKWKKKDKPLPPGLQKKLDRGGELPPGWKKKLEVGETLDPEVAKQARKLPEEILKRLPEIEEGIEILEVGDEIIKVVEDSLEIIDILSRGNTEQETD